MGQRASGESGQRARQVWLLRYQLDRRDGLAWPLSFEAAAWYSQAAEQGNAFAQLSLGVMYQTGRGVPQDDIEGYKWFSLGATYGDGEK